MARLIDHILCHRCLPPPWATSALHPAARRRQDARFDAMASTARIVVADDAAARMLDGDAGFGSLRDLCLVPPSGLVWVEADRPGLASVQGVLPPRWGAYCQAMTPGHDDAGGWLTVLAATATVPAHEVAAVVAGDLYVEPDGESVRGPVLTWAFAVDGSGRLASRITAGLWGATLGLPQAEQTAGALVGGLLPPLLATIGLMRCDGVELVTVKVPPRMARAHRRRYGRPPVDYTAVVASSGAMVRPEDAPASGHPKRPGLPVTDAPRTNPTRTAVARSCYFPAPAALMVCDATQPSGRDQRS